MVTFHDSLEHQPQRLTSCLSTEVIPVHAAPSIFHMFMHMFDVSMHPSLQMRQMHVPFSFSRVFRSLCELPEVFTNAHCSLRRMAILYRHSYLLSYHTYLSLSSGNEVDNCIPYR